MSVLILQAIGALSSAQIALADAAPEVSLSILPKLSHPAARLLLSEQHSEQTEDATGAQNDEANTKTSSRDASATELLAANGLWRVPVSVKPAAVAKLLLEAPSAAAHVAVMHMCSTCGAPAWGRYTCPRTGSKLCSASCLTTHNETKLMKFAS